MLAITQHRGFHITFANGITVSVQFGPGCYCQHNTSFLIGEMQKGKDIVSIYSAPKEAENWDSRDAEVAAWNKDGVWITKELCPEEGDDVIGYLSADKVLEFLNKAANYAPNEHQRVILLDEVKGG